MGAMLHLEAGLAAIAAGGDHVQNGFGALFDDPRNLLHLGPPACVDMKAVSVSIRVVSQQTAQSLAEGSHVVSSSLQCLTTARRPLPADLNWRPRPVYTAMAVLPLHGGRACGW